MTTRAFSKSVVVGVVPPNSPTATRSNSNGRLILLLETIRGNGHAVDGHDARVMSNTGPFRLAASGADEDARAVTRMGSAIVASA